MKLVQDLTPGAREVRVPCIGEKHAELAADRIGPARSRMFTLAEGYVDPEGPAFTAYYCKACGDALIAAGARLAGRYVWTGYGTSTKFEELP